MIPTRSREPQSAGGAASDPADTSATAGTPTAQPADADLATAIELAREAAQDEAGVEAVGEHVGIDTDEGALTHLFSAHLAGYRGWRWAVTLANAGGAGPATVCEVVLLPGPDALIGVQWVPWAQRVRPGDLGVGDLLPARPDDPRLVPGYLASGDPDIEGLAHEVGLGRARVLSPYGRDEAAQRWYDAERGPRGDMARGAPAPCGTCGFYLPLGGTLRAAFGACANEVSPADGHVVHVEYGCGAHSEAKTDTSPAIPVTEIVYDDTVLDYTVLDYT